MHYVDFNDHNLLLLLCYSSADRDQLSYPRVKDACSLVTHEWPLQRRQAERL